MPCLDDWDGAARTRPPASVIPASTRQPSSGRDTTRQVRTAMTLSSGRSGTAGKLKRSEEHTSELQSRLHLVCRLLLEKKKKYKTTTTSRCAITTTRLTHTAY